MQIKNLSVHILKPYPHNPRKNAQAVQKVAQSIKEFGFKQPIVVDGENIIVVGHTRWLAAKQLGLAKVPVLVANDLTPEQTKAYRLADNRVRDESKWDEDLLAKELSELQHFNIDLSSTGFNADEISHALATMIDDLTVKQEDLNNLAIKDKKESITKSGDLWLLGEHRILCGDAMEENCIRKLMENQLADCVFTDPPYNVNYEGRTTDQLKLAQDNLSLGEFCEFLETSFKHIRTVMKDTASFYIFHPFRYQREFQNALEKNNLSIRNQLIWAKHHFAAGFGRYRFQHEPIFYGHVNDQSDVWYGDRSQSTLWNFDKPSSNDLHPTMKPVPLIEKALINSSQESDIVLDVFGGSGSTLIACENFNRKARLLEIDPHYVDVSVERWEKVTGKKAVLKQYVFN